MAWSNEGFLYWISGDDGIRVWQAENLFTVIIPGSGSFLFNLPDGTAAVWSERFNQQRPNTARRLAARAIGSEVNAIPRADISFAAGSYLTVDSNKLLRTTDSGTFLFRLSEPEFPFAPQIVSLAPIPNGVLLAVRSGSSDYPVRIDDIDRCENVPVPVIAKGGIVNAANYLYNDALGSNSLLAVFGSNFETPPEFAGPTIYASPNQLVVQGPTLPQGGWPYLHRPAQPELDLARYRLHRRQSVSLPRGNTGAVYRELDRGRPGRGAEPGREREQRIERGRGWHRRSLLRHGLRNDGCTGVAGGTVPNHRAFSTSQPCHVAHRRADGGDPLCRREPTRERKRWNSLLRTSGRSLRAR